MPGPHHARPVARSREFLLGLLRKQIIVYEDGQLSGRVQLLDDAVVFGVILKPTARVDDAGDTEAIDLSHEMTAGVLLVLLGQFWALREGCVQNGRVWLSEKQAARIAIAIAHDLAARRIRPG